MVHGICSSVLPLATLHTLSARQLNDQKAICHIQLGCSCSYPWGRAKSLWLGVGIIVPVDDTDEADEAEEESSSTPSGSSGTWSSSASSSSSKGSAGIPSFDRAQARCRSLMMGRVAGAQSRRRQQLISADQGGPAIRRSGGLGDDPWTHDDDVNG